MDSRILALRILESLDAVIWETRNTSQTAGRCKSSYWSFLGRLLLLRELTGEQNGFIRNEEGAALLAMMLCLAHYKYRN